MLNTQKIAVAMSSKRERINALLGEDQRTDDQRTELRELTADVQGLEVEYRARPWPRTLTVCPSRPSPPTPTVPSWSLGPCWRAFSAAS